MELEENGGSGTAGSHWEKRLIMNDFMIGAASWFNPSDNVCIDQLFYTTCSGPFPVFH